MSDYQEFLGILQKRGSKPYKIAHCLGARDAWKWVRKNKWELLKGNKCSHTTYGAVIDLVNQMLAEKLLNGHRILFPHQMGALQLIAIPTKLRYKDGKLINNYRTDWKKTLTYWYEDSAALKQRQHIKRIQKYIYSIRYTKGGASYKNQRYYLFRANRSLGKTLGKKIHNEKMNAMIV